MNIVNFHLSNIYYFLNVNYIFDVLFNYKHMFFYLKYNLFSFIFNFFGYDKRSELTILFDLKT